MKNLAVVSVVALAVVIGLTIYARSFLAKVNEHDEALKEAHRAQVARLRATDERFESRFSGTLEPKRFAVWLSARGAAAALFARRLEEAPKGAANFHGRQTLNDVLATLADELVARKMGLREYVATTARWQEVLALREEKALVEAWRKTVRTGRDRRVLPLPDPAEDVTDGERALLREHARALEASLYADLMLPALEGIVAGDEKEKEE